LKLRNKKGTLYEGGIRTPMLVRKPGAVAAGSRCDEPVAFCDYLPTMLELAGTKAPACDGLSFAPALAGQKMKERPYLYWEFSGYNIPQKRWNAAVFAQAVRMGRWKAVVPKAGAAVELYDLVADPSETTDLAGKHPELVAKAVAYMKDAHTEPRSHATGSGTWL
jgi:arylsulfatase A-like enzyme